MATTRKGFTLIELLVVIAIIAILAAILFPVFARAKAKAQETQCLNNIKQISLAILTYASDYDQFTPLQFSGDRDEGDMQDVWELLHSYLKTAEILRCPVEPDSADMRGLVTLDTYATSYAVNGLQYTSTQTVDDVAYADHAPTDGVFVYFIEDDNAWYDEGYGGIGYDHPWEAQCSIDFLSNPVQVYMVWDAVVEYPAGWSNWSDIDELALHATSAVCKGWQEVHANRTGGTVFLDPDFRHGGRNRCNFAFCDGHAKSLDTNQATTGGYSTWYLP